MITFDDGYRDNYELAFPILKSHRVKACFFLSTGFLDHPRVPWWEEIAWMVHSSKETRLAGNTWTIEPVDFVEPDRQQAIHRLLRTFCTLQGHETEAFLDFLAEATTCGRRQLGLADTMWMTWDMVREMHQQGMCIGGHTVNHQILANLTFEEQDLEICECRLRIECELGEEISAFSYPVGNPETFTEVTKEYLVKHGFRWAFSYYGGFNRFSDLDALDICRVPIATDVKLTTFRSITSLPQLFA